ncbi:helix-turn-helix domain-containing protein [Thalassotalea piscium]|uniref:Transcriptional regulator with XRE-family HTH domain n=1 Tax=Thalassotalea piscium TaxID=1230533 RepID=A0A7X0NG89_9GAMM|nr:helix-turn-helix transcriptional regulator [Thalassotalea piscium]MBB6542904.1 transcriptional regulator with XRE-family HTH domain [Thalassotalea piscium]
MSSENAIKLALNKLGCTQKELAAKLSVSPAQVSKWKGGEYMSLDMEEKLGSLAGIGKRDPDLIVWTGGIEQADKWKKLICYLADSAIEEAETGYNTYTLIDEEDQRDLLCRQIMYIFRQVGIEIPQEFPSDLDFDYELDWEENPEKFENLYSENSFSKLISKSFNALNDVYGFYAAYIEEILDDWDLGLMDTPACNIEPCLLELAFCKIAQESPSNPNFKSFKHETLSNYEEWIEIVKNKAFANRIPLKAELMNMVNEGHGVLGHEAEAESLGFNAGRLHPDVYMDEILKSHRLIHQVLPVICKKLGITEEELQIDSSEFSLK